MHYSPVDTPALNRALAGIGHCRREEEMARRELRLLHACDAERPYAEAFVQEVFYRAYRARLVSFYPLLLSIGTRGGNGRIEYEAVAGARPASAEKLFLEHYLVRPVEEVVGVARERIIEIGNLAPAGAGQARWLITTLNAFMRGAGFTHVVFTAIPKLKNSFSRMGLPLAELAAANRDVLPPAEQANWGNYYDTRPRVFVGDLRIGEAPLRAVAAGDSLLQGLYRRATQVGEEFRSAHGRRV